VAGMTLEIDDVSRRYGPRWALAHVTARIAPGESWMLLGHNGSGKSTLLGCLATSLRTHHGQIRWGGGGRVGGPHGVAPDGRGCSSTS
jgi:ABC-type multidrug transport system ATPase subunit